MTRERRGSGSGTGAAGARRGQRGQAMAEVAFTIPILATLMMGIFQFGMLFQTQIGLSNAIREAARLGAASPATNTTGLVTFVTNQLQGTGGNPGLLAANVENYASSRLAALTVSMCSYTTTNSGIAAQRINVSLSYDHPAFFPPFGAAFDAIDGVADGALRITVATNQRLENAVTVDPLAPIPTCP